MHDVLVHYLEVNFPEIAEQLAHTHGREPTNEERAAAAERLRELIRRLRRGAEAAGAPPHAPRASAAEMIAGVNGELSADERAVLDHFFELFARSMQRTQAAIAASPEAPAAAQQALDLLQGDPSQVYTLGERRRFVLRAGVPTESLAAPEGVAAVSSGLLRRALEHNEVFTVEDLAAEELTADEAAWLDAGFRGFAAIALSPPLERPVGVLALFRRTPWRLDRRDAVRLEDLAVEAGAALRAPSPPIKGAQVAGLQGRPHPARGNPHRAAPHL